LSIPEPTGTKGGGGGGEKGGSAGRGEKQRGRNILHHKYFFVRGVLAKKKRSLSTGERIATDAANILREFTFSRLLKTYADSGVIRYFRGYVDDCFAISYFYDEAEAHSVHAILNDVDPAQFQWTMKASRSAVDFLDLHIKSDGDRLLTETFRKPGCEPQYLAYSSSHAWACKNAIYSGEVVRHLVNCSLPGDYEKHLRALRETMLRRGHPSPPHIPYDGERRHALLSKMAERDRGSVAKKKQHCSRIVFKCSYGSHCRSLTINRRCRKLIASLRQFYGDNFLREDDVVVAHPARGGMFVRHHQWNFVPVFMGSDTGVT